MSIRLRRRTKRGWSEFDPSSFRFLYYRHFCTSAEVPVPKFDAPPLRPLGSNPPDCSDRSSGSVRGSGDRPGLQTHGGV